MKESRVAEGEWWRTLLTQEDAPAYDREDNLLFMSYLARPATLYGQTIYSSIWRLPACLLMSISAFCPACLSACLFEVTYAFPVRLVYLRIVCMVACT